MAYITFNAPLAREEPATDPEPPPGRRIAEGIASALATAGFPVVEPVSQHETYGWAFSTRDADGRPVWCMLRLLDDPQPDPGTGEWQVVTHTPGPAFRSQSPSLAHDRVDAAVMQVLAAMRGVSRVRWFETEDDLQQARASGR